jgi:predicted ArsR family transcriptional regulator
MPTPKPELHDPRVLRAIAHPVRNRILTALDVMGPLRAADVATELGIPANQASFHLRQLGKYGLVEEDPGAARDRRDRVWKLTEEHGYTVELSAVEQTPGGKAASAVFRRSMAAWGHQVVDLAYGEDRDKDTLRTVSEQAVRLTKAEAKELSGELEEVLERWVDRTRGRGEDRRTYLAFQILMPYPDQQRGEAGG